MASKNRCYLADRGPAKPPRLTDPWRAPNNAREMDKGGSVPGRSGLAVALALFILALTVVVAGMGAMVLVAPFAFALGLRPALLISEVALIVPGLLALAAFRVPLSMSLGLNPISSRTALFVAALAATLWVASLGLFEVQYALWAPPPGYLEAFQRLHEALRPRNAADALVSVVAIAAAPAICEELLLRGIVLPALRPALGSAGAIVTSAALFALIHWDLYRAAFTFALGVALGVLRVRTGSLVAPVLAHALVNTITFLAAPLTEDTAGGLPAPRPMLGLALLSVGAALSALLMRQVGVVDSTPADA
jgi:membrane protease YdiL (CAAX protease family)